MARNDPQVNLRMSADLKDRLDAQAVENKRSLTSEITTRLEESFTYPTARRGLLSEMTYLESEIERLTNALKESEDLLEKREKALFEDRVELRKLAAERTEMLARMAQSEEMLDVYKRSAQDFAIEQARKDTEIKNLRDELEEVHQILRNYSAHSERLQGMEKHMEKLTKGLAVYGRAFELSHGGNQVRAMEILDKAIDDVEKQEPYGEGAPEKKAG